MLVGYPPFEGAEPLARRERERPALADPMAVALERVTGGEAKAGGRSGGVYIPPYKLAQMMQGVDDRSGAEYQRMSWEALKKAINGHVNKVNVLNLKAIVLELFNENIVRGRALLVRSLLKSQLASPTFTHVYAALVAVVNTKMPELGELLLKRIVSQFRRAFKRNDKGLCLTLGRFIAHLVNQQVSHELLALQVLTVLLEQPTDQSVEVACALTQEVGAALTDVSPEGLHGVFERLRGVLPAVAAAAQAAAP
jgi:pre-mRNA-splicing factor CWC22